MQRAEQNPRLALTIHTRLRRWLDGDKPPYSERLCHGVSRRSGPEVGGGGPELVESRRQAVRLVLLRVGWWGMGVGGGGGGGGEAAATVRSAREFDVGDGEHVACREGGGGRLEECG